MWDYLNDSMCDRIESEWSVDGDIHDYRFFGPGSHTFTVLHSRANS